MKPISKQAEEFIKARKISAHLDFEPLRQPHYEAEGVLLTTVAKRLSEKECVTSTPINAVTRKGVEIWCFTRDEMRELIEKIQGL
jgi:hypothetical protein